MATQTLGLPIGDLNGAALVPAAGLMPLAMVTPGEDVKVISIKGRDNTKRFLENLGFVEGAVIAVVTELAGNVIVSVKDTRVAVNKAMATRILTVKA
ncbi:MAG TPA: ferrous iron transport protein A [Desulfitobacterium dehalogenans]|uniref:Ferrous iron transport protein A n=1 Tax=Desulfitobacterium dehalogenans TaxID=36854 RepID=A0A7C6Z3D4_9FIRM|nr:ferrous iron transport protein A [Desulfitobacterium dehalogenans]